MYGITLHPSLKSAPGGVQYTAPRCATRCTPISPTSSMCSATNYETKNRSSITPALSPTSSISTGGSLYRRSGYVIKRLA